MNAAPLAAAVGHFARGTAAAVAAPAAAARGHYVRIIYLAVRTPRAAWIVLRPLVRSRKVAAATA